MLTGKYQDGIPAGSRGDLEGYEFLRDGLTDKERLAKVAELAPLAESVGATPGQFSIAWCLQNPYVSSVITGASRVEQLRENLKALEFVERFTPELIEKIDRIFL